MFAGDKLNVHLSLLFTLYILFRRGSYILHIRFINGLDGRKLLKSLISSSNTVTDSVTETQMRH